MQTKVCVKCDAEKATSEFYKNSRTWDGLEGQCKECKKAYSKRWQEANPERRRATKSAWKRRNKEAVNASSARWREKNPERKRSYAQEWYSKNKDHQSESHRAWWQANPDKVRAKNRKRRAVQSAAQAFDVVDRDTRSLQEGTCMACGSSEELSLEHLIPLSRGGDHGIGNLATLCTPCNSSKKELTWTEWKHSGRPRAVQLFGQRPLADDGTEANHRFA